MTEATDVFDDALLASVYDNLDPWAASDEFYLGLAREIGGAVLDLGCGRGRLACRIAAAGLEVVGADPAGGMLGVARSRPGTEAVAWRGSAAAVSASSNGITSPACSPGPGSWRPRGTAIGIAVPSRRPAKRASP